MRLILLVVSVVIGSGCVMAKPAARGENSLLFFQQCGYPLFVGGRVNGRAAVARYRRHHSGRVVIDANTTQVFKWVRFFGSITDKDQRGKICKAYGFDCRTLPVEPVKATCHGAGRPKRESPATLAGDRV